MYTRHVMVMDREQLGLQATTLEVESIGEQEVAGRTLASMISPGTKIAAHMRVATKLPHATINSIFSCHGSGARCLGPPDSITS